MEPITQALLGAAVAQTGFSRILGRRALGWGALIGMLPDLDIIAAPLHGGFGEMIYHRGSSHAAWFGPVVGPLLGLGLWKWRDGVPGHLRAWMGLCVLVLFTHPLLDVFTPYGTQLFAPFSRARFAWNGVGIIDPLYTALLALGVVVGAWAPRRHRAAAAMALVLSTLYLGYGVAVNARAERAVRSMFAAEGIARVDARVYPTVFQPWLRRFVARTPRELRVGLYTPWGGHHFWWQRAGAPPADPRVDDLLRTWEGQIFSWFAMEEIAWRVRAVLPGTGGVVVEVDDLRYGIPGDPPDQGFWGIRARYDADGRRVGPVERFARRRSRPIGPVLRSLWRATWGDFGGFDAAGTAAADRDARGPPALLASSPQLSTPTSSAPAAILASSSANAPALKCCPRSSGPSAE